ATALALVAARRFDPHVEAIVVGTPDSDAAPLMDRPGVEATPVPLAVDLPERIEMDVEVAGTAFLVLADAFAAGWTVTVDGAPRRMWQTNYLVRGIVLQAGDRRVEFSYRTPGLRAGAAFALITWGVFGIGTIVWRKKRP